MQVFGWHAVSLLLHLAATFWVFEKLAGLQPAHPLVHTDLGLCFEGLGETDRARAHFLKAVEVAPQHPHTNLARERLNLKR